MNLIVQKTSTLHGLAMPPGSKSQSIRSLLLALLSEGESVITNVLDSDDAQAALRVCRDLGADIAQTGDRLRVTSAGPPMLARTHKLNSGDSGITTRFIMPMLGLRRDCDVPVILDCQEQMRARLVRSLVDALRKLGLSINYLEKDGVLPVSIEGALTGGVCEVDGITSQFVSALLLSLPCAQGDSEITVRNLHERPYMEMTLHWLDMQNIRYTHTRTEDCDIFRIKGGQRYKEFQTQIAGDFSSASYMIAGAALMQGRVELQGLDMRDPQGDKRLVHILKEMGADIMIAPDSIVIQGGRPLRGIEIDANDIPDMLPTLAVIGTQAEGLTRIYNVPQARLKETDRIHSMTEGLTRLGAHIEEYADGMSVRPGRLTGAALKGYGDHRTVMALSLAGMLADGITSISDAEAINKTFPGYVALMRSLGARMKVAA